MRGDDFWFTESIKIPKGRLPQKGVNLNSEAQQVFTERILFFDAVEDTVGPTIHGLSARSLSAS